MLKLRSKESEESEESKGPGCYALTGLGAFAGVILWEIFFPDMIPFRLFEFVTLKGSLVDVLKSSWIIFAWGTGFTLVVTLLTRNHPEENHLAEAIFGVDLVSSVIAGVCEEIVFRWWLFFSEIPGYKILNFLLFDFLGWGISEMLHLNVFGPIANFATLGLLKPQLLNAAGWAVGAAILTSNGKFRDGHLYQGPIGWINSWFGGMFFFYLMFNHGLIAAIIVHMLYDVFIDVVVYLDRRWERSGRWADEEGL